jgi:predicted amidophosphoribosyltransferase
MRDEGPSEEDLERLDHDAAYCPACGAEVWDMAEVCPQCQAHLGGNTASRSPLAREWRTRWAVVIAIALVIAFLLWAR